MIPNRKYLSRIISDVILALIHGTIWWPLFWLSGYPLEEWAVAVVVLYLTLWLSRGIVVSLSAFVLGRLTNYGKRILTKAGVETIDIHPADYSHREKLLLVAMILFLLVTVLGASLSIGTPALVWFGLTPLAPYFNWIGWTLLVLGASGLSLVFAASWLVFVTLDNLVDSLNEASVKEISGFGAITERVVAFAGIGR